jgi:hypothetical protein
MPKFDVFFKIYDEYVVTLEADSFEQATDMVYENPESDFLGREWIDGDIEITNYQEVTDD